MNNKCAYKLKINHIGFDIRCLVCKYNKGNQCTRQGDNSNENRHRQRT